MLRRFRIATLLAVMTAAACKTSDKPAAPPPAPAKVAALADQPKPAEPPAKPADAPAAAAGSTELQTKAVSLMQRMADMFASDGTNCEKLAADLRSFVADNKGLLSQIDTMQQQASEPQREAFLTRMAAVQATVATKMQGAMTACAANPSVLAAMKQFPGEGE